MTPSVLQVTVDAVDGDGIQVVWTLDAPAEVDVAVGPTPDRIDHRHAQTVGAGTTSALLRGFGPGRHFVSVSVHDGGSAVVAADRRLPFEGLQNFRDLGGYRVAGGSTTKWNLVFRSDSLHKLTPRDFEAFARLGMRRVFDLRGDEERERHPNPLESLQLAIIGRPEPSDPETRAAMSDALAADADGERILRDLYMGMLEHSGPLFGRLIGALVEPGGVPAVFHCHAGKDRTGMAAALLLLALGVDREEVLDDYELTRRYRTFEHQQDSYERLLGLGLAPEAAAGVLTAPRWAMADALQELDAAYGGIERYLTGPACMAPAAVDRLRSLLTE